MTIMCTDSTLNLIIISRFRLQRLYHKVPYTIFNCLSTLFISYAYNVLLFNMISIQIYIHIFHNIYVSFLLCEK